MSGVYVVVSTNGKGEVEVCETFAGQQSAVSCVQEVSGDTFNHYPTVKVMADNSIQWNYVNTPNKIVSIYWKAIKVSHVSQTQVTDIVNQVFGLTDRLKSALNDDGTVKASALVNLSVTVEPDEMDMDKITNDEFARSNHMPGGFDWNDKPVFSEMLFEDPESVKDSNHLTDIQKMALVTARIKKLPSFSILVPFVGTFVQSSALDELKRNTVVGKQILKMELEMLDRIREDQINIQYQIRDY